MEQRLQWIHESKQIYFLARATDLGFRMDKVSAERLLKSLDEGNRDKVHFDWSPEIRELYIEIDG